ncbi:MAG: ATP-binding protein [Actinomycetota bacterium]|nr:ATP-binding protein [Actinomycetota bacterium]
MSEGRARPSRPLDRLPSIRAKLGLVIVFAVGMTVLLVYLLLGYALRNTSHDTERLQLLHTARLAAESRLTSVPDGVTVVFLGANGHRFSGGRPEVTPPRYLDGQVHEGSSRGIDYVAVPVVKDGKLSGTAYALRPSPGEGLFGRIGATFGFLRRLWWQLLAGGAIAAGIALLLARLLAIGMTSPLREMARAAGQMAQGEYGVRVDSDSRDEVGQLARVFNRMSADLEQVERLRRDLVANVSHELKTPISALRAHLENLLDGVEQPDRATIQIMLQQSERLSRLVDQLLDLSRLESGDIPMERRAVALRPLAAEVASEVGVALGGRVRIEVAVPEGIPPLWADRERVHQVLFNLLDNAVRFTPPEGVVRVSAVRRDDVCEVSVADTGPGIPPEHLPLLFERFYRVESARSRGDGGTGIGLAIARSIVEAHGGRIWAESEVGRGSVFRFELPLAPPESVGEPPELPAARVHDPVMQTTTGGTT